MLGRIVEGGVRLPLLVLALVAGTLYAGLALGRQMPVDVLPEFAPVRVEVQSEALGLSAIEVEQLITSPMENLLLNGVPWLEEIHSESLTGLSSIVLTFEPGTDPLRARQLVAERLSQGRDLPNVSKAPVMLQPLSSTSRVMMVRLDSAEISPIALSVLARWTVKPALLGVQGVANVSIWGQREQQMQVHVDPVRLSDMGVTLDQVVRTTANALWVSPLTYVKASTPGTGGFIDTPNQRLGIQHILPIRSPADLGEVTLESGDGGALRLNGRPARLRDVATVVEDHQPLIGDAVAPEQQGLILVVEKFPEANALEVTEGVEATLGRMAPGLGGVVIDTDIYRPATYIDTATANIRWTLLIGIALALLGLVLLYSWRLALIVLVVVPLALAAATAVLALAGHTLNAMMLLGLVAALVVLIDEVVVDVDRMRGRLAQPAPDSSRAAAVAASLARLRGGLFYATLVMFAAVVPVFFVGFLDGLAAEFFLPLVAAYALALAASFAAALLVTPTLTLLLHRTDAAATKRSRLLTKVEGKYDDLLRRGRPGAVTAATTLAAIAVAGLIAVPVIEQEMTPRFRETTLLVHWTAPPGTSHPEMSRITSRVSAELAGLPGVDKVGAHVGRAIGSDEVSSISSGEIWVTLSEDADQDASLASVEQVVDGYPGVAHELMTYVGERTGTFAAGPDADELFVRVYGQDLEVLEEQADRVGRSIAEVDGVAEATPVGQVSETQLEIEVDLDRALEYGVKPGEVRRSAATMVSGIQVGSLFESQKIFEVMVWGDPLTRHDPESVRNLRIETPSGQLVRLGDVADVRFTSVPASIAHDAVSRYVDVRVSVADADVGDVADTVEERIETLRMPFEYHAELQGGFADRQSEGRTFLGYAIAALVAIFLLFQACFGSWRLAGVGMGLAMLSLAGGLVAVAIAGGELGLGALIGVLAIVGIASRHLILAFRTPQEIASARGSRLEDGEVLALGRAQVAPMLTTATAVLLVLLPVLVTGPTAGQEVLHPLAVFVVGGVVSTVLVVLLVAPFAYLRFAPDRPALPTRPDRIARHAGPEASY